MIIVDGKGAIKRRKWTFNGFDYEVVGTQSNGWSAMDCIDTVKRADGRRKEFVRKELNFYFKKQTKQ